MEKITRREFLKLCGKIVAAIVAADAVLPDMIFGKEPSLQEKFRIPLKPFRRSDLYQPHNLAG